MYSYNVTPELLRDNLLEICPKFQDEFNQLPTILKTSFTKTYNKKYGESIKPGKQVKAKGTLEEDKFDPEYQEEKQQGSQSQEHSEKEDEVKPVRQKAKKTKNKKKQINAMFMN